MFKKLRNRLLLINMAIISIVIIISFITIYLATYSNVNLENYNELQRIAVQEVRPNDVLNMGNKENMQLNVDTFRVTFSLMLNKYGEINDVNSILDIQQEEYESAANKIFNENKRSGQIEIDGRTWMYFSENLKANTRISETENFLKITFMDITESSKTLNQLAYTLTILFIIMMLIIYFISKYFASREVKPLEELWIKQKQFIEDASHELKTPVSIINANMDVLLSNPEEKIETQIKWANNIKKETKSMEKLVNDLLSLAKSENNLEKKKNPIDLSTVVNNIVLSMETIIYEKDIKLETNIQKEIVILGDYEKIKQVIKILLENAIKYTNDLGTINVKLYTHKNRTVFSIENTGRGIKKEELKHIFDRFYRADKARTNIDNSYGLGLAIAKNIVTDLGGNIYVGSIENKTTIFTIKF